jgi:hypothetical protein
MKKILLLIFIPFQVFSQNASSNSNPGSPMKTISNSEGVILMEEHSILGNVGNKFKINIITLSDLDKHDSTSGLRFIMSDKKSWPSTGYSSFADVVELKGLLNFLDFVKVLPAPVNKSTGYAYITSGNFRVSAFIDAGETRWRYGVFIDKNYTESFFELDAKEFLTFYQLLVSANSKLSK